MMKKYDVIVAGGGMSGVAAAVSAARHGMRVLLVEQTSMLGGLGTGGLMTMVMTSRKWFYGIGREILDDLQSRGEARRIDDYPVKDYERIPFDAESMKRKLDDIVLESGAEVLLYSKITGVQTESGYIKSICVNGPTGDIVLEAPLFIDATGDGMLAYYAGEDFDLGDKNGNTQAPTMTAYYAGVDFDRYEAFLKTYENGPAIPKVNMIHDLVPKAVAEGVLSVCDLHHPGIFRISPCFNVGVMNAGHIYGADCLTGEGLTKATIAGRKMAKEYLDFYRRYVPGFEKAYMTNTCSYLGLRETRRIRGRYVTTFADKAAYRKFPDAIMRFDGGAVSDVHASSADKKAYEAYYQLFTAARQTVREDDWAELPYRSLLPAKTQNLLVAGRCLSADREVQGQLRIMGYCFMMGQAAGTATALAAAGEKLLADIDIGTLQEYLRKDGMEI